jgi:hypothetical protein
MLWLGRDASGAHSICLEVVLESISEQNLGRFSLRFLMVKGLNPSGSAAVGSKKLWVVPEKIGKGVNGVMKYG